jgi:predicted ATPase
VAQVAVSTGAPSRWDEGVAQIRESLEAHREAGARTFSSFGRALLAEAYMLRGLWTEAGDAIEDGLTLAVKADEGFWEAELHRLRGEVRLAQGRHYDAVLEFEQAIAIAGEREQRSLELRALVSLYRLVRKREAGLAQDVRARLTQTYAWFSEGFGTEDLREAKALLDVS